MNRIYFCRYQFLTKDENTGLEGCCNLLLGEGVAYQCPYSVDDIFFEKKNRKNVFKIKNDKNGECKCFEIGIHTRINFMSKFNTKFL